MQLTKLKGIGVKTAEKLATLGIHQVIDLLFSPAIALSKQNQNHFIPFLFW